MPSNNKAYLTSVSVGTSGSVKEGYTGSTLYTIRGEDADDGRPITIRVVCSETHKNWPTWKPLIKALEKGYLVVIYGFQYMVGRYGARQKDGSIKAFPNNIHGDAFTKHNASAVIYNEKLDEVSLDTINQKPPAFADLFN